MTKPKPTQGFIAAIEQSTGMSIEELRRIPVDEFRGQVEANAGGRPLQFRSFFPLIGRGSVLKDRIVSSEQVNRDLDAALKRVRV